MSNLKIDESRLPQDGRLRMVIDGSPIDFRLSTLPTVSGEKIVMRILDRSSGVLTFEELGLNGLNLKRVEENIRKAHGMILVTGPTGSGKSTTLYAVIGKIIDPSINIVTMEDPVEYRVIGINQSQVNSGIGYDFASGLRSIVRQDPDVILIGEIRDLETATMAIQSALTGHVVLSTLHTNDAAGAIPRLIDMGIEPFLITSSTNAIVAQRLVRKICDHCKEKYDLPPEALTEVKAEIEKIPADSKPKANLQFFKGKGCSQCNDTGYRGRFGIFEALPVSDQIKQLALKRVSGSELTKKAIEEGMITLKQDGILKALNGDTTLEEVWRVTRD
jgi:type II secretory ATPase GspE/PulE/Tfp pilus assembly ATPase PilB-like protein